jgi:hypothetical protein
VHSRLLYALVAQHRDIASTWFNYCPTLACVILREYSEEDLFWEQQQHEAVDHQVVVYVPDGGGTLIKSEGHMALEHAWNTLDGLGEQARLTLKEGVESYHSPPWIYG